MDRKKFAQAIIYQAKTECKNSYFSGIPDAQSETLFWKLFVPIFLFEANFQKKNMQATGLQMVAF